MKHRINKIATIFMVSIFVLSGLGISYAAWTDTITIGSTVNTGSLCWEFVWCDMADMLPPNNPGGDYVGFGSPYADLTCNPGFVLHPEYGYIWGLDKNVAWGEQERLDLDGDGHDETLAITLNNVYPCNFNELSFYVKNCGTIPLKFDHVVITGNQQTYTITSGMPQMTFDLNGNNIEDFEIWWKEDYFGYQLEPGMEGPEMSFWMHILQDDGDGVQGESFTFTINLVAIQWDKYVPGP